MLPKGKMQVTILDDGTVKTESGDMGGVSHKSADQFYAEVARLMGGTVTDVKLKEAHHHHHEHEAAHEHQHADGTRHSH